MPALIQRKHVLFPARMTAPHRRLRGSRPLFLKARLVVSFLAVLTSLENTGPAWIAEGQVPAGSAKESALPASETCRESITSLALQLQGKGRPATPRTQGPGEGQRQPTQGPAAALFRLFCILGYRTGVKYTVQRSLPVSLGCPPLPPPHSTQPAPFLEPQGRRGKEAWCCPPPPCA